MLILKQLGKTPAQVGDFMETQVQVQQFGAIVVLSLEEKSSPSSSIILLYMSHNNPNLRMKRYSIVSWRLISTFVFLTILWVTGFVETNFILKLPLDFLKTLMWSRKVEFLAPWNCWGQKGASIFLGWWYLGMTQEAKRIWGQILLKKGSVMLNMAPKSSS